MRHVARLLFQEPSLFAVAKLLETGLVNLSRVHVLWKPVVAQLLEVRHLRERRKHRYKYNALHTYSNCSK